MGILGRIAIVCLAAAASVACLAPQNSLMAGVDMSGWGDTAIVVYSNSDSIVMRDLNIALRYNDTFKASVLPLKVGITTPDARHFEEVVELRLSHPSAALTVATTESVPYRTDVLLSQKGSYTFTFEPQTEVQGVEAIGIEFNYGKR